MTSRSALNAEIRVRPPGPLPRAGSIKAEHPPFKRRGVGPSPTRRTDSFPSIGLKEGRLIWDQDIRMGSIPSYSTLGGRAAQAAESRLGKPVTAARLT